MTAVAPSSVVRDVRIPTREGDATLSADVYRPVSEEQVPALVTVLPYRKDAVAGVHHHASLRWLAERGYACLLVDLRGTGSSDGVMRPPFDSGEADDAIAAIEWAAAQPWCTGAIGMWGGSYGGVMSMRTASRRPAALRAITSFSGMLDPERDFVHPGGVRGAFTSLGLWATMNLGDQLLPPLLNHHSEAEQRRWRRRVNEAEPYIVNLFRHSPGDPVWRERVIDASAISAPALCVAGWRDLFCDGSIRAYEEIQAPKRLIAGPWMHSFPQDSPFEPIDSLQVMLRWFDHWLRGQDNGVMDEPAVSVYVQGNDPGWRSYEAWPPTPDTRELTADSTLKLIDVGTGEAATSVGPIEYVPDPTTGALSGLWSSATGGFGLPLDQHDDDTRAVSVTSEPLADSMLIVGRAEVTVIVTGDGSDSDNPQRVVVRLCDVDPQGRSTLITSGLLGSTELGASELALWPTAYRVAAGHRIRVVISDADFPRLWPAGGADVWRLSAVDISLPIAAEDAGKSLELPPPEPPPAADVLGLHLRPRWQISRDHINDGIEVGFGIDAMTRSPNGDHILKLHTDTRASVQRNAPDAAVVSGTSSTVVELGTGETIEVTVTTRLTQAGLWARGEVTTDGNTTLSRTWEA